jgi:DNA invertase Pin-like site-specific DNA recombinase
MRAALCARVSTHEQQTLGLQVEVMSAYIEDRGWRLEKQVEDIGSGSKQRARSLRGGDRISPSFNPSIAQRRLLHQ